MHICIYSIYAHMMHAYIYHIHVYTYAYDIYVCMYICVFDVYMYMCMCAQVHMPLCDCAKARGWCQGCFPLFWSTLIFETRLLTEPRIPDAQLSPIAAPLQARDYEHTWPHQLPGIQTRVLTLVQHALWPQSHCPSSLFPCSAVITRVRPALSCRCWAASLDFILRISKTTLSFPLTEMFINTCKVF